MSFHAGRLPGCLPGCLTGRHLSREHARGHLAGLELIGRQYAGWELAGGQLSRRQRLAGGRRRRRRRRRWRGRRGDGDGHGLHGSRVADADGHAHRLGDGNGRQLVPIESAEDAADDVALVNLVMLLFPAEYSGSRGGHESDHDEDGLKPHRGRGGID